MPDITMCINVDCKNKYKCRRYMAKPNTRYQSYFMPQAYDVFKDGKGCTSFMSTKGWSDIMPIEEVKRLEDKRDAWIKQTEAKGYVQSKDR